MVLNDQFEWSYRRKGNSDGATFYITRIIEDRCKWKSEDNKIEPEKSQRDLLKAA